MKAIDRAQRKKEKNECIIKAKNSAMTHERYTSGWYSNLNSAELATEYINIY